MISVSVPTRRRWWVQRSHTEGNGWVTWRRGDILAMRYFDTHAEAMAYADKAARS